jgi:PhnB protein
MIMATKVNPVPSGYCTVTPDIVVSNVSEAIKFYKQAFNAWEVLRMNGPDGKVMHAEIQIGNSRVMLCSECRERNWLSPKSRGGTTGMLYLYVENVDDLFNQAVRAGAAPGNPVTDMFWGDRVGDVTDPWGHRWSLATHTRDLTPQQIEQGSQQFCAEMSNKR